ncbi:MAG: dihydrolipoamide acetyltransferase family protein, partial [Cyanobium sp.]
MATHDIFMPALSSTMTEGKIVEWLKKPGDRVERGESVLVVESDKADMDVESFNEGFLAAVLMPAGGTAPVGETIGLIVESEAEIAEVQARADTASPSAAPTAPVAPPAPAPPATVPAPAAAPSPVATTPVPVVAPPAAPAPAAAAPAADGRIVATPRARKLASQLGVALTGLRGSGPNGRIQSEDVETAAGRAVSLPRVAEGTAPVAAAGATAAAAAAPQGQTFGRPGETVAFNTLQHAVVRNMNASLAVPCFRVGYTITTDRLDALYKTVKGKGVTMTALLAKAVGVVLARHPQVNAATTEAGMAYPAAVNVAVAVAMEDGGLITPVLAAADRTDLYSLSRGWADLVERARAKQLKPEEYSTGTFTLSNLGMFGVDRFDAILPPGTGAILAVAASRPTVVAGKDGSIAVKR